MQMVNAYYHPMLNEIVFPAAILQPPFFDKAADDAVNFGAMGAVVGHEMTHGYDDKGRKFDSEGNLRNWWEEADAEEFTRRAAVMVAQANAFVVHTAGEKCGGAADGPFRLAAAGGVSISITSAACSCKNVNGALTNGEDLADLGGLKLAYAAFVASRAEAGAGAAEEADADGFTPSQRFFLGWAQARSSFPPAKHQGGLTAAAARFLRLSGPVRNCRRDAARRCSPPPPSPPAQVWRANITPEEAAKRLTTDPHAPHTMRVNSPLRRGKRGLYFGRSCARAGCTSCARFPHSSRTLLRSQSSLCARSAGSILLAGTCRSSMPPSAACPVTRCGSIQRSA